MKGNLGVQARSYFITEKGEMAVRHMRKGSKPMVFLGREAGEREVVAVRANQVRHAIGAGDPRTLKLFNAEIKKRPTAGAKLLYCSNFLRDLENHRAWAQRHLWFIEE